MNLQKLHDAIIEKAKIRGTVEGYKETHHILPRSMGGGDEVDNLIDLTAKEHFVIHHLLAKIHGGPMAQAFGMMCLAKMQRPIKEIMLFRLGYMNKLGYLSLNKERASL